MNKQTGFIVPALLILISILLAILLPLQHGIIRTLRDYSETKITQDLNLTTKSTSLFSAYNAAINYHDQTNKQCFTSNKTKAWLSSNNQYCIIALAQFDLSKSIISNSMASLNYDFLTPSYLACPGKVTKIATNYIVSSGYFSDYTCELYNSNISQSILIPNNLFSEGKLSLDNLQILATNGFVNVNQIDLSASPNLTIFSAGQIHIERLISEKAAKITIIAASGDIKINSVQENIALQIFGRKNIILPQGSKLSVSGFNALQIEALAIGFD